MERFGLQHKNFSYTLTTDTASTMTKLSKLASKSSYTGWLKFEHWIGCVAHRMHLVVSNSLKDTQIKIVIDKVRSFTTKYARNGKLRGEMNEIRCLAIINAPSNRWYYSMFEVERMIELKEVVLLVCKKYEIEFTDDDFETMKVYLEILQPFKQHATALTSRHVTISQIIPMVDDILVTLNELETKFQGKESSGYVENLLDEMKKVLDLSNLKKDKFIAAATFLDPRYKTLYFTQSDIPEITQFLMELSG